MKVLELFAGTRSIGKAFEARGHEVFSVEWDKSFENISLYADIGTLTAQDIIQKFGVPDVIWASPDCETFSIAGISHHRRKNEETGSLDPVSDYAKFCDAVDQNVLKLIDGLKPKFYFIENPRGGMRKMAWIQGRPRYTVTYCQYGDRRMKPTDIWTNHPNPKFKPPCKNGDSCHEAAPRGSMTGTQGMKGSKERSVIPEALCQHIVEICEKLINTRGNDMANKHMPYDLAQMQSLPLEAKIIMTKQRIRQWYEYWDGLVYVSFSGGKDSTVLKHIVDSIYDDVPALFVNTGLEYPEIQQFAKEIKAGKYDCFNSDVEIVRPEMRFDEVVKKYGYPAISKEISEVIYYAKYSKSDKYRTTRVQRLNGEWKDKNGNKSAFNCEKWKFMLDAPFDVHNYCCTVMKKNPSKKFAKVTGRKQIVGTMAAESRLRYQQWLKAGCNAFDAKKPSSQPLSFWTEQDILHYIKKYNVPYCSVYGDIRSASDDGQLSFSDCLNEYDEADELMTTGCDRTGCIFCMFGCHLEKEPNRFQRLKQTHPKQYKYCIGGGEMVDGKWQPSKEGLGLGKVLDYIGVKYD